MRTLHTRPAESSASSTAISCSVLLRPGSSARMPPRIERVSNRDAKGGRPLGTSTQSRPGHGCSHYVEKFEALTQC